MSCATRCSSAARRPWPSCPACRAPAPPSAWPSSCGYRREEAARFSFLLATPDHAAARRCMKVPHLLGAAELSLVLLGMVAAAVVGLRSASGSCSPTCARATTGPSSYYRLAFAALVWWSCPGPPCARRIAVSGCVIPVLTAAQMREADRRTIEEIGLPGAVLMENAGAAVAARGARARSRRRAASARPVRQGQQRRRRVRGRAPAARPRARGVPARRAGTTCGATRGCTWARCERSGGALAEVAGRGGLGARARGRPPSADLVVDALLGTGLRQAPDRARGRGDRDAARAARRARDVRWWRWTCPPGLPSDTRRGRLGRSCRGLTVTFAAPKYGHVLPPACDRVGELVVADIGIPARCSPRPPPSLWLLEARRRRARPTRRARPARTRARSATCWSSAGAVGKTGAAVLAATGALRAGRRAGHGGHAGAGPAAGGRGPAGADDGAAARHGLRRARPRGRWRARWRWRGRATRSSSGPGLGQEPPAREFVREFAARVPGAAASWTPTA